MVYLYSLMAVVVGSRSLRIAVVHYDERLHIEHELVLKKKKHNAPHKYLTGYL